MLALIYFLVFFVILGLWLVQSMAKPKRFPPGPSWYPYLGCSRKIYSMTKQYGSQLAAFRQLAKEYYTDVLGLNLGGERLVVFYGEKNFKKIMNAEEFEGRPDNFFLRLRCFGERGGISFVDGPLWKVHRRFTLTHLRNAGFGKGPMEKDTREAVQELVDFLRRQEGTPLCPKDFLSLAVMNVLWKCAAGEKIKAEKWEYLQGLFEKRGKAFGVVGGLLNRAPWIRFLLPGYTGYSMLVDVNRQISDIVEEAILRHKNHEITKFDFINAFLQEMDKQRETFTEVQLKVVLLDLIIAGSATTSSAVEFALLQVLRDQGMQRKIQCEIDTMIGGEQPCWSDSFRLTYTAAFLLETQRFFTILPLAGPRRILRDTEVDGYIIPKDTTVLFSLADLHMDPGLWKDPEVFRPERFLDENGCIKQLEHFYPFGLGRRRCPGDSLARIYLFLSFTSILQNFTITSPDTEPPSIIPDIGIFASAKRFKAIFSPRSPRKLSL